MEKQEKENEQLAARYDDYVQEQANPATVWPAHCQHVETFVSNGRVACKNCGAFITPQ